MLKMFSTAIGGQRQDVIAYAPEVVSSATNLPTHHLFVIDRSGSMNWAIGKLVEQLHEAAKLLSPLDVVTLAWFSGPGQCQILVQGASVTPTLHQLIDQMNGTVGTTCFSEILAKLQNSLQPLGSVCRQSVIHLFTDGQPVVPWSSADEQGRCMSILRQLIANHEVIAVHTIGYGNYYNRQFLVDLSGLSAFGQLTHASDINQYYDIVMDALDTTESMVAQSLEASIFGPILYMGDTSCLAEGSLKLPRLSSNGNNVIFLMPHAGADKYTIGDTTYNVKDTPRATQAEMGSVIEDFFYGYAEQSYYHGKRQVALDLIVNNVKDKAIADAMINAFSIDEVAAVQTMLRNATQSNACRHIGGKCGPGYMPAKDAFCVMDLLRIMIGSTVPCYYLPLSNNVPSYERTTRKVTDEYNQFTPSSEPVREEIRNLVWNEERMNLSLKFKMPGVVHLNPKVAQAANLPSEYPSKIYRTHTIIKDGQLNIKRAEFLLPTSVVDLILAKKPKKLLAEVTETGQQNYRQVILDLTALPIINRTYIENHTNSELLSIVKQMVRLEASQKVAGIVIGDIYDAGNANLRKQGAYEGLNVEQIKVLETHGIRKDGVYGGIGNKVTAAADSDSYETKNIIFQLKGAASLPSAKEFREMQAGTKAPNLPGSFMLEAYHNITALLTSEALSKPTKETLEYFQGVEKTIITDLQLNRQALAEIKMAKFLTGDFFHGLIADEKGNYTYSEGNDTMVVKVEYKQEYI